MAASKSIHNAAPSAAGYLYQARLALAECLRFAYTDSDVEVAIEKLDDVSFEKAGNALELLQTKHHLKKAGDLSDTSVDLWKTLRIWADKAKSDPSLPARTCLSLVTTAQAPPGSAAALLRPADVNPERSAEKAEALLIAAAQASMNAAIAPAIAAFTSLTPGLRKELLSAVEILDGAPLIADLSALIDERLRMIAPRGKAALAREQLEGWWWPRVCDLLQAAGVTSISVLEVEQKLDDIRDSLKRDALPLDMEHADPPEDQLAAFEEMKFVRQLRHAGVGPSRLEFAKRDYYRAFTQRSRWIRQSLLFDGEVGDFEKTLLEEWQPRFAQMCESLAAQSSPADLSKAASALYHWVETDARFPFRAISRRFLTVGSYHMLADDLRVGWHRDYQALCADEELENA